MTRVGQDLTGSAQARLTGRPVPLTPFQAVRRLSAAVGLALCPAPGPLVTLDLLCRGGELLEQVRLLDSTTHLLGVDPWPDAVARARRRLGHQAQIRQLTGQAIGTEPLPGAGNGVDLALGCLALGSTPCALSTLAGVISRLRVGGRLYLTDLVPPGDVRRLSLLSLAQDGECRDRLTSMAAARLGAPELFGLLADASAAAERTTSIRISTGGLGGFEPSSPQVARLSRNRQVAAALGAWEGSFELEILHTSVLHAHVLREA